MRWHIAIVVAVVASACARAQPAEQPAIVAVDPPPPPPVDPPPPPPPPVMDVDDYRQGCLKGASQYFRGRRTVAAARTSTNTPEHDVVTVKTVGRSSKHVVFTCGLGRLRREQSGLDEEHRYFELVAYSKDTGPQIGAILSAIGAHLFQSKKAPKSYDGISLPKPMFDLKHFDLRPAGEIDVHDRRVSLYKVVPMSLDELEETRSQGGSQWLDAGSADPAAAERELERWAPALAQH